MPFLSVHLAKIVRNFKNNYLFFTASFLGQMKIVKVCGRELDKTNLVYSQANLGVNLEECSRGGRDESTHSREALDSFNEESVQMLEMANNKEKKEKSKFRNQAYREDGNVESAEAFEESSDNSNESNGNDYDAPTYNIRDNLLPERSTNDYKNPVSLKSFKDYINGFQSYADVDYSSKNISVKNGEKEKIEHIENISVKGKIVFN